LEGQIENVGAWLSITVTLNVHGEEEFNEPSTAVHVTKVIPLLNTWPVSVVSPLPVVAPVSTAVFEATLQLSVAVALNSEPTDVYVQTPLSVLRDALEGQTVITGLVTSFTITLKLQLVVPLMLVAVAVTDVVPKPNVVPETGE